jgi:hypothetical protein
MRLQALIGQDTPINVQRKHIDKYGMDGFVVGLSGSLLLLHLIHGNSLHLDGYRAVRLKDITEWSVDTSFIPRALRLLGRSPIVPNDVPLDSWPNLVAWASSNYDLISIEKEKELPDDLYIGNLGAIKKQALMLREIDTHAVWDDRLNKHRWRSITKVGFGSGYMEALAALSKSVAEVS